MELNLHKLADFLTANQLAINMDKTHIEEVMIKQKKGRLPGITLSLQVTNAKNEPEVVNTTGHCRILGLNVQANLTWTSHLESGLKPLLPSLRRNIGALKNLSKLVPFSSRNTIARGLIQSRLSYLLCVWGGNTKPNQEGTNHPKCCSKMGHRTTQDH